MNVIKISSIFFADHNRWFVVVFIFEIYAGFFFLFQKYNAKNLLDNNNESSWKCHRWIDYSWIIFELEQECLIDSCIIQNSSSAFIEVLISSQREPSDFKVSHFLLGKKEYSDLNFILFSLGSRASILITITIKF